MAELPGTFPFCKRLFFLAVLAVDSDTVKENKNFVEKNKWKLGRYDNYKRDQDLSV